MDLPSSHRRSRHSPGFSGVYPGNSLRLVSLPSLPLWLECNPPAFLDPRVGRCRWWAHVCQRPTALLILAWAWSLAGGDGDRALGRKVQLSSVICCHWLLRGSSKPVMEKCFYWQNTFYIHMHAMSASWQTAEMCGSGLSSSSVYGILPMAQGLAPCQLPICSFSWPLQSTLICPPSQLQLQLLSSPVRADLPLSERSLSFRTCSL